MTRREHAIASIAALLLLSAHAPAPVSLPVGSAIADSVAAYPPRTTFLIGAGTHLRQSITPKQGDSFIGDSGAVLDGQGTTARAIWGWDGARWVDSVTVRGLRITHYAPPAQDGAISAGSTAGGQSGTGWIIDSVQIDSSANLGLRIGDRMQVLRSRFLSNGTLGMGGTGRAVLIDGNEVAFNAAGATSAQMDFEAGATKFVRTDSAIVRGNLVHDNGGPGIWFDIENDHALIEGNRVERNVREGIVQEIGYAATIRNNTLIGNGQADTRKAAWPWGACIGIHASGPDIDIAGNTCIDNAAGIVVIQQERGAGARGRYLAQGITVHDNTIDPGSSWPGAHANGAVTDIAGDTLFRRALSFQRNVVIARANPSPFAWAGAWRTAPQWRAYGLDTASALRVDTVRVAFADSAHFAAMALRLDTVAVNAKCKAYTSAACRAIKSMRAIEAAKLAHP